LRTDCCFTLIELYLSYIIVITKKATLQSLTLLEDKRIVIERRWHVAERRRFYFLGFCNRPRTNSANILAYMNCIETRQHNFKYCL